MNKPFDTQPASGGMGGLLRLIAMIAVLGAAGFGTVAVFGVVPQEQLLDYAMKSAAALGILAVGAVVVAVLGRRGR